MSRWTPRTAARCFVAAGFVFAATSAVIAAPAAAPADDTLAAARDLYASAAYEDALAVLNRLRAPDGLRQVPKAMADPDVAAAANQPPLSDLRTLAIGFNELAAKAATPPPLPAVLPTAAPVEAPPAPRQPVAPQIYAAEDSRVVP